MDKEQTRAAIAAELPKGMDKYAVRSDWLVGIILAFHARKEYPYNANVEAAAAVELGGLSPDEAKRLGTLVYNAQKFASEEIMRQAGFIRATQEALAAHEGKHVTAAQLGSLGGSQQCRVKRDNSGRYCLMLPRSRSRCMAHYADNWIRA